MPAEPHRNARYHEAFRARIGLAKIAGPLQPAPTGRLDAESQARERGWWVPGWLEPQLEPPVRLCFTDMQFLLDEIDRIERIESQGHLNPLTKATSGSKWPPRREGLGLQSPPRSRQPQSGSRNNSSFRPSGMCISSAVTRLSSPVLTEICIGGPSRANTPPLLPSTFTR